MSGRETIKSIVTESGAQVIDDTNDAIRVNVVAGAGSGGTASNFGDPFPSAGTAAGFQDFSGNMAPGLLDASGNLQISISGISIDGVNGAIQDGVVPSRLASVLDLTNSNPLTVGIVDANGDQITSFGGGTQYTEGDADASITGTAMLWEDVGDTLEAVSASKPLPVNVVTGNIQYTELDVDSSITGTAAMGEMTGTNTLIPLQLDGSGNLKISFGSTVPVNIVAVSAGPIDVSGSSVSVTGTVSVTGYPTAAAAADNTSNPTITKIGAYNMLWDGSTWDRQPGNSADGTLVNLGANNDITVTGTVAVTQSGTWDEVGINDSGNSITVDDGGSSLTVDGSVTTSEAGAGTASLSNVNDTAVSTTLLSANANRLGATIHNDSTAILYVKFGTTASTTSYTVKMIADAYYEVPYKYTGRIDGIWASDASGAARITELSA